MIAKLTSGNKRDAQRSSAFIKYIEMKGECKRRVIIIINSPRKKGHIINVMVMC